MNHEDENQKKLRFIRLSIPPPPKKKTNKKTKTKQKKKKTTEKLMLSVTLNQ